MKKVIIRVLLILVVLGAAYGGYRYFDRLPQKQLPVATAKVRRGDVIVRAYSRGELRAVRSATLTAPNLYSTVQVTRLAPLGSLAKEKTSSSSSTIPNGARRSRRHCLKWSR